MYNFTPAAKDGASSLAWYTDILQKLQGRGEWTNVQEISLLEPYRYLDTQPGKEIRARLIDAFQVWLGVPPEELELITDVIRRLHTASLLVDDIEDSSDLRRGVPTAHTIYGVPQTINAANYVYFQVFARLASTHPDTLAMVTNELVCLHRGQGLDLFWRDSLLCPAEHEYVDMVINKTGGLFRIAIKLMQALSPLSEKVDYVPLANLIGLLFQIRDDYMNLQSTVLLENKGFCEDLTEGKFSFPVIHAISSGTQSERILLHILKQRTTSVEKKEYAVRHIEACGSFAYTRQVLAVLDTQAREEVRRIESELGTPNPALLHILDALHIKD
ncbi:hypothetical protein MVES1_000226 [Malassezia vespertilionis]|uniref:(2E,6E)-farnesyl diphosphate synthase n=1 Tax=Malassezia vespertilionis TaxID=2020962 RepID=A0A2N1JG75_9BASI|nr:uncharacterized protein MVES1_000226 [Malassezia vespertilionis]PKI85535.1 Bts1p [Malassezia vespertilionis]WFD04901.1 hypothetical protein MVES1_000226 [Malassezia vespertilionis]